LKEYAVKIPVPAPKNPKPVLDQARKVLSLAKWSRAVDPEFFTRIDMNLLAVANTHGERILDTTVIMTSETQQCGTT
jgi:hypothetical protein